ncbi:MAG TPA: GDSL-type esterase/lipase family protein [Candidatus Saccharimonadales bacterium]
MNSNPNAKVVLCYGDSNTWGQKDDRNVAERFGADVRWTSRLQNVLGDNFYVIEEGLGGRTTNLDHTDPAKPGRNGFTYFVPCILSHNPDAVIIMLGTNDIKKQYNRPIADVARALGEYVRFTRAERPGAKILLVCPPVIDVAAPKFAEYYHDNFDTEAAQKSIELIALIRSLADQTGVSFFDVNTVMHTGQDGIHLNQQAHDALANSLSEIIRSQ